MENFNGKLRDELLDREVFYTLLEVQVLTKQCRQTYNRIRPHSSLGYRPPAPEAILPADPVSSNGRANIEHGTTTKGRSLLWLEKDPDTNAKDLLARPRATHSGRFSDGQLRTLQHAAQSKGPAWSQGQEVGLRRFQ